MNITQYRKLGITSVPYVNATKVAALLGRNKFEPRNKAFLDFLQCANPTFSPLTSHKCPCSTWQEYIRGKQKENNNLTSQCKEKIQTIIEEQALVASQATSDSNVQLVLRKTDELITNVLKKEKENDTIVANANDASFLFLKECTREVSKTRGNLLEEKALNNMEEEMNVDTNTTVSKIPKMITQRNTKLRYIRAPAFSIGGKIDGYDEDENVVIEIKNRMRKTPLSLTPYDFEVVQVILYMKMMRLEGKDCCAAIIREVFPDGSARSTTVKWSEEEWEKIERGMGVFAEEYAALDEEGVDRLMRL
jgi:hypothetical protein